MIRSFVLVSVLLAAGASAGEWKPSEGARLSFKGAYMGEAFDGTFQRFTPKIVFDTGALESAVLDVDVDVTSAATGIDEYDEGMQEPEFFHGGRYPSARFVTKSVRALGEDRYEADAELTIRGKTVSLPFPFRFEVDDDKARLRAEVTIRRLDFDIGTGDWADTSLIANEVEVRVDLPLERLD